MGEKVCEATWCVGMCVGRSCVDYVYMNERWGVGMCGGKGGGGRVCISSCVGT